MIDDGDRALGDYEPMTEIYADEADSNPINVAYDRPAILELAGDVRGRRVLDIGCATGALAAAFLERGAQVVGVDLAPRFIELARARLGRTAELHVADISDGLPFLADRSVDLVAASLVLHYLRDWTIPLREFARVLRPGGALVLSTHHPTVDVDIAEPRADYFETVLLTDTWIKAGQPFTVRFYHRPLSAIVDALADAGFLIERIHEPIPDPDAFAANPAFYHRIRRGPWFLFLRAVPRPVELGHRPSPADPSDRSARDD
jgi:SAM-dependent methyltransferase